MGGRGPLQVATVGAYPRHAIVSLIRLASKVVLSIIRGCRLRYSAEGSSGIMWFRMLVSGSSSSSIGTWQKSVPGRLISSVAGEVVAGVAGGILPLVLASSNSSINWWIVLVGLSTCCSMGSVGSGWSSSASQGELQQLQWNGVWLCSSSSTPQVFRLV